MKISLILCATAFIAFACAPLKKYTPENVMREDVYGRGVKTADTNVENVKWPDFFNDKNLQALIQSALDNNLDLKVAYERINQANAMLLGAKLAYVPSLSIDPSGGYSSITQTDSNWGYSISASMSWQIDIFGKLANQKKMAEANVEKTKDMYQAVRVSLIAAVANTYYTLLMLDEQLRTSREMEKIWQESVLAIHDLKKEGFADEVAVSQYEATYASLQATSADLEESIQTTENTMSILLSQPCQSIVRSKLDEEPNAELIFPIGVPVNMLYYRPDVREAQRSLEIAYYMTKDAWLNFFPSLNLTGATGVANLVSGTIMPVTALANVTAGLVAPVLSSGRNRSNLKKMQSQQQEAKYNFDQVILNAGKEVNDAIIGIRGCIDKNVFYQTQVSSLIKARDDTKLLMDNTDTKTYLDVLAAHNALIQAEFSCTANRAAGLMHVVDLYAALGGGSEY